MSIAPDPRMWGKLGQDNPAPYPVLAHMLDTSASAFVLWDRWLRPGLRDLLTESLAPDDPSQARAMFAAVAGLHDLGKISAVFQLQQYALDVNPATALWLRRHRGRLRYHGYDVTKPTVTTVPRTKVLPRDAPEAKTLRRHEALSLQIVAEQWPARTAFIADAWAAAVIGGHHGRFNPMGAALFDGDQRPGPTYTPARMKQLTAGKWGEQQQAHIEAVLGVCGTTRAEISRPLADHVSETIIILSGLVTLADWMASADDSVAHGRSLGVGPAADMRWWMLARHDFFRESFDSTLGGYEGPLNPRHDILGDHASTPSELQLAATRAGGGLWIATAPTGDGKTEAGMLRHTTRPHEGPIFALPTRATTDSMFSRLRGYYGNTRNAGSLVHAYATLNAYYAPSGVTGVEVAEPDGNGRGLRPIDWLAGRGRGTLAPVSVSTCDQVLMASLRQPRSFLRLAALANKHVILDEVHTYDRYQAKLLVELLAWFGATRTRVTMLSASLPTRDLNEYVAAYTGKPSDLPAVYPGWTSAGADGTVVQEPVHSRREYDLGLRLVHAAADDVVGAHVAVVEGYREMSKHTHIAVVVNTVDRCIGVAEALRSRGHEVLVLHSRMTAGHRKSVADRIDRLREERGALLGGLVVVGTQTIEISLDVDFDHMVSDLAPTSSLIQRAGRLWRHSDLVDGHWDHEVYDSATHEPIYLRNRHAGKPILDIVVMNDNDRPGYLAYESQFPYLMAEQKRTLAAITRTGGNVRVPGGVQALVDASVPELHDDGSRISDADFRDGLWVGDLVKEGTAVASRLAQAGRVVIPMRDHGFNEPLLAPDADFGVLSATTTGEEQVEAATRFIEQETADYLIIDPTGRNPWAWHGTAERAARVRAGSEQARELLSATLSLRTRQAETMTVPAVEDDAWRPWVPALRSVHPIVVSGAARYDSLYGLVKR